MPLKIVTIIGARPQIIKAAALSRAIREKYSREITEIIVHTGQHYDENMSQVFFEEMQIPRPDYNLNVGSSSHGKQTGLIMIGVEEVLKKEKPHCLVVFGDTNSTLAASVTASKMSVPVIHIEAGLRSYNKKMPEESNRILCDHLSALLFSPTLAGLKNLEKEGFNISGKRSKADIDHPSVFMCGDVMYDNSLFFSEIAQVKTDILQRMNLSRNNFFLATIHRDYNTDVPERLTAIFKALDMISSSEKIPVIIPLHPRTLKQMETNISKEVLRSLRSNPFFKIISPASFLEMIALEKNCEMIFTDSGGVQKESFFFRKPCIILRSETEWIELVENGNAIVADASEENILRAFNHFRENKKLTYPEFYGNGKAAELICSKILENFSN